MPGSPSNADGTGAVMQALSRGSKAAQAAALAYLRKHQRKGGGFSLGGNGVVNSQSTAWAIQGMIAAGGDPGAYRRGGAQRPRLPRRPARRADGHYRYSRIQRPDPGLGHRPGPGRRRRQVLPDRRRPAREPESADRPPPASLRRIRRRHRRQRHPVAGARIPRRSRRRPPRSGAGRIPAPNVLRPAGPGSSEAPAGIRNPRGASPGAIRTAPSRQASASSEARSGLDRVTAAAPRQPDSPARSLVGLLAGCLALRRRLGRPHRLDALALRRLSRPGAVSRLGSYVSSDGRRDRDPHPPHAQGLRPEPLAARSCSTSCSSSPAGRRTTTSPCPGASASSARAALERLKAGGRSRGRRQARPRPDPGRRLRACSAATRSRTRRTCTRPPSPPTSSCSPPTPAASPATGARRRCCASEPGRAAVGLPRRRALRRPAPPRPPAPGAGRPPERPGAAGATVLYLD